MSDINSYTYTTMAFSGFQGYSSMKNFQYCNYFTGHFDWLYRPVCGDFFHNVKCNEFFVCLLLTVSSSTI